MESLNHWHADFSFLLSALSVELPPLDLGMGFLKKKYIILHYLQKTFVAPA